ncbi:hypothetical protein K3N28_20820 [Glycomyces sp. TRM65418]|uniref:hypothetical protein n=1 Tax=Glycomyces sp. TRM65418 TaxID=2867006 RepID=UPI001CE532BD|nr:hypothetical protein [Glycomyces sp. TRM65418]MCC3765508.1 hypothetical protein [Glycomyces sp. TRM65418]QZD55115.1 hypothetical protein K3N28_20715 [Glycomyces sp. TRM65418]
MNGIEYEDFMAFMQRSLAADRPELADMPVGEFARCSLQDAGVDSLALTELVIRVNTRWGHEFSDRFLASPEIDVPARWWDQVAGSTHDFEKGDQ